MITQNESHRYFSKFPRYFNREIQDVSRKAGPIRKQQVLFSVVKLINLRKRYGLHSKIAPLNVGRANNKLVLITV